MADSESVFGRGVAPETESWLAALDA